MRREMDAEDELRSHAQLFRLKVCVCVYLCWVCVCVERERARACERERERHTTKCLTFENV